MCTWHVLSQRHSGVTPRLLFLPCRWNSVTESPDTSMDHTRVITTREKPQIFSTGCRVWNEERCSEQWAAASFSSTVISWVFCFWTVFPLGDKAAHSNCLARWQYKREITDMQTKVPLGKSEKHLYEDSHTGATPWDCEYAWLYQDSVELVCNSGSGSKYVFLEKAILLNLGSLILAILISVSSSWLQCLSPKALFPQKCWLMLSHQQADEQKRKHSGERLSESHHPGITAEAKEPLSHTPPPTGCKTPS